MEGTLETDYQILLEIIFFFFLSFFFHTLNITDTSYFCFQLSRSVY